MNDYSPIKRERDCSLDIVAAILMVVVILHHAGVLVSEPYTVMHVFNFFMPWFFFKAGMFHKADEKIGRMLKKTFSRLFIPLIFCIVTNSILKLFGNHPDLSIRGIASFLFNVFNANGVIWFVVTLIIARIIFTLLPKEKSFVVCYCAISFLLADIVNNNDIKIWLTIKEMPMVMFYYTLGFLIKDFKVEKMLSIGLFVLTYALFIILDPSKVDMKMEYVMFGHFEIAVVGNIIGILLINALAKKIEKKTPSFFISIGRESLAYYILHMCCCATSFRLSN